MDNLATLASSYPIFFYGNGASAVIEQAIFQVMGKSSADDYRIQHFSEYSMSIIHAIVEDITISPFDGEVKLYLFKHAEEISALCWNAMLSTMENKPLYGLMFFCANRIGNVLPTVLSRSVLIHCPGKSKSIDFDNLIQAFTNKDYDAFLAHAEKASVEEALQAYSKKGISEDNFVLAKRAIDYNLSPKNILDYLMLCCI